MNYKEDELISSFHKYLRLKNIYYACFFAKQIKEQIGVWRVKQYLFYVCFEETYNLELFNKLLILYSKEDSKISDLDIYDSVASFVLSSKKWETKFGQLFYRYHFEVDNNIKKDLLNNNKRYELKDFLKYMKWNSILSTDSICFNFKKNTYKKIPLYEHPEIFAILEEGIEEKDISKVLYFSLFIYKNKSKIPFNYMKIFFKSEKSKWLYSQMEKMNGKYSYSYNYILLFLMEFETFEEEIISELTQERLCNLENKINNARINNDYLPIPLYALDYHTNEGKKKLKRYDIYPNVASPFIDMRLSGHWLGVFWRISAINQYGKIKGIPWECVKIEKEILQKINFNISRKNSPTSDFAL